MIHLYCGDGKGKTTAAMGLALRMAGRGKPVVVAQFLKGADSGERRALARPAPAVPGGIPPHLRPSGGLSAGGAPAGRGGGGRAGRGVEGAERAVRARESVGYGAAHRVHQQHDRDGDQYGALQVVRGKRESLLGPAWIWRTTCCPRSPTRKASSRSSRCCRRPSCKRKTVCSSVGWRLPRRRATARRWSVR